MKNKAKYVDGFIVPVSKSKIGIYKKMAQLGRKVWLEYGALDYVECMGDDTPAGKWTSFPRSVKLKKNEVVFFSYITYKSRAHRDKVNKKVMSDPRFAQFSDMPFDGKRLIYGGFKVFVKA